MATKTQGIKLDDATRERLQEPGTLKNRSPHFLMKEAIASYLDREERYEQEKREDAERWEEYLLTGEARTHEEVLPWLTALAAGKAPE